MSEALPGMPEAPPPPKPRAGAAVLLFRRTTEGAEVFWVKREAKLHFAGGYYAFPGGRVDKADAQLAVEGATGEQATLRVTAARELLEEAGVLVAAGAEKLSQAQVEAMRRALLDETTGFGELLAQHGLKLEARDFPEAGRWVTPEFMPGRFDVRFFLVEAPQSSNAVVWPGELSEGEWIRPAQALRRWEEGTALLHPPNLHAMRTLGAYRSTDEALATLRTPAHCPDFIAQRIEFQRGIRLFPLRTPTLPPATHTTAYVLGHRELLVVDPGSPDDAETDRLVNYLRELVGEGCVLKALVLTHHHGDHIGGAARVMQQLGLPLWCHERTADRVGLPVERLLREGDVLELQGEPMMWWRVLHTPGHARGHVTLVDEASRAAVVGDMVAGVGTIVIDPPEGDMAEYLRQLERLKVLPVRTLYPAHGPAMPDGPAKLDEYLQHRAWREAKVLEALSAQPVTLEELVPKAYDDVEAFVWPIAERNTQAIIDKLEREQKVDVRDGRISLRAS